MPKKNKKGVAGGGRKIHGSHRSCRTGRFVRKSTKRTGCRK